MMTILVVDGWNVMNNLVHALIPITIVVLLPVLVVWLVMRTRQHEVDKKTEILMKAIENGAELLGWTLDELIDKTLAAMQATEDEVESLAASGGRQ